MWSCRLQAARILPGVGKWCGNATKRVTCHRESKETCRGSTFQKNWAILLARPHLPGVCDLMIAILPDVFQNLQQHALQHTSQQTLQHALQHALQHGPPCPTQADSFHTSWSSTRHTTNKSSEGKLSKHLQTKTVEPCSPVEWSRCT